MDTFKQIIGWIYNLVRNFLTTKDAKAVYWQGFAQVISGMGDLLIQNLTSWDPDNILTLIVGLMIARITKRLNK